MGKNFDDWWSEYMLFTAKAPASRLIRRHAEFIWAVKQGGVRRIDPAKNKLVCSGEPPNVQFFDRNTVSSCVAKGLFNLESCQLCHPADELFSDVAGYADTRPLDLPDDVPPPVVNRKPGRPPGRFSKTWRVVPVSLQEEFARAVKPFSVPLRYQPSPGFVSVQRNHKDRLSGNEYQSFVHEVRFYFNNLKWRSLITEDVNIAGVAVDVLRVAFNPMMSLQRTHPVIQPDKLNVGETVVRAALEAPAVQAVLKKLRALFLPESDDAKCLSFAYTPAELLSPTKLDRILELETLVEQLRAENDRLTKLLAAANVTA